MNKIFILCILLSACTVFSKKNDIGLLGLKKIEEGTYILKGKELTKKKCLYIILGIIPIGSFDSYDIEKTTRQMLENEPNALALGNTRIVSSVFMAAPFYYNYCNEISGTPVTLK